MDQINRRHIQRQPGDPFKFSMTFGDNHIKVICHDAEFVVNGKPATRDEAEAIIDFQMLLNTTDGPEHPQ